MKFHHAPAVALLPLIIASSATTVFGQLGNLSTSFNAPSWLPSTPIYSHGPIQLPNLGIKGPQISMPNYSYPPFSGKKPEKGGIEIGTTTKTIRIPKQNTLYSGTLSDDPRINRDLIKGMQPERTGIGTVSLNPPKINMGTGPDPRLQDLVAASRQQQQHNIQIIQQGISTLGNLFHPLHPPAKPPGWMQGPPGGFNPGRINPIQEINRGRQEFQKTFQNPIVQQATDPATYDPGKNIILDPNVIPDVGIVPVIPEVTTEELIQQGTEFFGHIDNALVDLDSQRVRAQNDAARDADGFFVDLDKQRLHAQDDLTDDAGRFFDQVDQTLVDLDKQRVRAHNDAASDAGGFFVDLDQQRLRAQDDLISDADQVLMDFDKQRLHAQDDLTDEGGRFFDRTDQTLVDLDKQRVRAHNDAASDADGFFVDLDQQRLRAQDDLISDADQVLTDFDNQRLRAQDDLTDDSAEFFNRVDEVLVDFDQQRVRAQDDLARDSDRYLVELDEKRIDGVHDLGNDIRKTRIIESFVPYKYKRRINSVDRIINSGRDQDKAIYQNAGVPEDTIDFLKRMETGRFSDADEEIFNEYFETRFEQMLDSWRSECGDDAKVTPEILEELYTAAEEQARTDLLKRYGLNEDGVPLDRNGNAVYLKKQRNYRWIDTRGTAHGGDGYWHGYNSYWRVYPDEENAQALSEDRKPRFFFTESDLIENDDSGTGSKPATDHDFSSPGPGSAGSPDYSTGATSDPEYFDPDGTFNEGRANETVNRDNPGLGSPDQSPSSRDRGSNDNSSYDGGGAPDIPMPPTRGPHVVSQYATGNLNRLSAGRPDFEAMARKINSKNQPDRSGSSSVQGTLGSDRLDNDVIAVSDPVEPENSSVSSMDRSQSNQPGIYQYANDPNLNPNNFIPLQQFGPLPLNPAQPWNPFAPDRPGLRDEDPIVEFNPQFIHDEYQDYDTGQYIPRNSQGVGVGIALGKDRPEPYRIPYNTHPTPTGDSRRTSQEFNSTFGIDNEAAKTAAEYLIPKETRKGLTAVANLPESVNSFFETRAEQKRREAEQQTRQDKQDKKAKVRELFDQNRKEREARGNYEVIPDQYIERYIDRPWYDRLITLDSFYERERKSDEVAAAEKAASEQRERQRMLEEQRRIQQQDEQQRIDDTNRRYHRWQKELSNTNDKARFETAKEQWEVSRKGQKWIRENPRPTDPTKEKIWQLERRTEVYTELQEAEVERRWEKSRVGREWLDRNPEPADSAEHERWERAKRNQSNTWHLFQPESSVSEGGIRAQLFDRR